jgi:hypothetical protein
MKAALIAAMTRSGWTMLGAALGLLIALWLVMSSSYRLLLQGPNMRLELAPARPPPPGTGAPAAVAARGTP